MKILKKWYPVVLTLLILVVIIGMPFIFKKSYESILLNHVVMEKTDETMSENNADQTLGIEEKIKILLDWEDMEDIEKVGGSLEGYTSDEALLEEVTREINELQKMGGLLMFDTADGMLEEYYIFNYIDVTAMQSLVSTMSVTVSYSEMHISLVMDVDTLQIYEYYCMDDMQVYESGGEREAMEKNEWIVQGFEDYSGLSETMFLEYYWVQGVPYTMMLSYDTDTSSDAKTM